MSDEKEMTVTIHDNGDREGVDGSDSLKVTIKANRNGIEICPEGYGDMTTEDGHGAPIFLEFYDGKLVLRAWADINQEDPTHQIDMEEARESNRKD